MATPAVAEDQVGYYVPVSLTVGESSPAYAPLGNDIEVPIAAPPPQRQKTINEMVEEAQQQAADRFKLTKAVRQVMSAIKQVESKGYPWALCVNLGGGRYYSIYPRDYYEAAAYLGVLKTDNIDIGPWQVNYSSLGKPFGFKKTDLLNPYVSATLAAYTLGSEIAANGNTWNAIGNYHSRTLWRKIQYVNNVKRVLRKQGYTVE
ncbi:MAG: transglycosylase SLT domain-containing protein [Nitrospirae bacterium]|nr:transglycosylase SLT domain-containing protein [Nitrospirota bacterium]